MAAGWQFLQADAAERVRFADRAATLALPHGPAAPPNRNRRVLRIDVDSGVFYLKCFGHPQWQNRLRFALTPPRARDDAEREALVTLALRQRGIATPRPVARGADRDGSYYLCAALAGRSLLDLLRAGAADAALLRAAAGFCGDLLARGCWLPDLSADHLFVAGEGDRRQFAVIDLHNATIRPPGPPPLRLCIRVLRHFARSVRRAPVGGPRALAFAVRLLRAAGCGDRTRAVLRRLPPFASAARYEQPGRSCAYAARDAARSARELGLLARIWPGRPGESVLDVPCGTGRLLPFLRARGHRVRWADAARAMLQQAARSAESPPPGALGDALALPFADAACDGVVMFRFLHHLPPEQARIAVGEACRVARRFVVVSFFHPCSVHHLQRALADLLRRRVRRRHAQTLGRLCRWFAAHGFHCTQHAAELPFARDLWLAGFERDGPAPEPAGDGTAAALAPAAPPQSHASPDP